MELNVTELIKGAIANTAKFRNDDSITTARGMIPHMRTVMSDEDYPQKYIENIQYSDSKDALMDIYFPDNMTDKCPVFVEVHGGAWYFGQKSSVEFKPFLYGLERGYICVSVDYTLSPDAIYPQAVIEIKRAIAYLKAHADEYNIDPDRIALWGGSAGAHLAALAAYSSGSGYLNEYLNGADDSVKVLVLWYGCHHFHLGKQMDKWIYQNFFGETDLSKIPEALVLANPSAHITANAPYTLLQHGLKDGLVPYEQSVYMADVLKTIAGEDRYRLDLLEDCDHADIKMFAPYNIRKVFDYVDSKISHRVFI